MSCSIKVLCCLMEYYDEETQLTLAYRYALAEIDTLVNKESQP